MYLGFSVFQIGEGICNIEKGGFCVEIEYFLLQDVDSVDAIIYLQLVRALCSRIRDKKFFVLCVVPKGLEFVFVKSGFSRAKLNWNG